MSRIVSIVALALFGLFALVGGQQAFAQEWAEKMFDSLEHDFEGLARGAKAEHRFTITNLYKEDVHISSIRSSCGCTLPKLGKNTLKSRESVELVTEFDTIKFQGSHNATVTVTFDRPTHAEVRLNVTGYVRRDVVFKPGQVQLGTVDAGKVAEKQVIVQYAGRSDWEIVDIEGSTSHFEVEMSEKQASGTRASYELLVRLKDTAPEGHIDDRLVLITNDPERARIPLAVRGFIRPSVSVSPASLQLGVIKPGDQVTKQLVVRGNEPFKIARISCPDNCFRFDTPQEAKKLHRIPVTFTAGEKSGRFVEKIEIEVEGKPNTLPAVMAHFEVADE
ncbi:MAG: DUF1573 domain-containing protein [Planctomycetota bacterium]|nr:MAG: DUF1573 domain-containing protein [Planctomycetota bacterium]REJ90287.1 MAG: DUF1573 domain-containing protein [Planctomycetota bacterium]REK17798.1 MAG: DUF1573 domain-containing protein [Planctomycetota bacterium]REK40972.1 MAG: DUF1573 domain-containing protein [Planctomycetota bacterium]